MSPAPLWMPSSASPTKARRRRPLAGLLMGRWGAASGCSGRDGPTRPRPLARVPDKKPDPTAHHDLENVIEVILDITPDQGRLSVAELMDAIGQRSFGPLLLVPALIALSPVGAIPGLPAVTSAIIIILTIQILTGHKH